tara:strand:- start:676 stop:1827 length:1152 start_codon:yes stop_codon:yes gene_type:complete
MSSGKELQEMEVGTKQSKTAVNANAKPGEPMENGPQGSTPGNTAQVEDLGGPTPDNYAPDNDSAKLKPAGGTLKQVRDVVNKGAKPAEKMASLKSGDEIELEADQEVVAEEPATDEVAVVAEEEIAEEETTEEEVVAEAPEYTEINIEDDVNALIAGEELSEDFKNKAKTILETAVKGQVNQIKETLVADYDKRLLEEVEEIKSALNERIDSYLEYVADEWFNENQLAVEGGLKEELTESFMTGLKSLFEEHYVEIPEDKYDVLQNMVDKLDDMESKLNEQIERNVTLNQRLSESASDVILADVSEGLAATQKEKLATLSESVEFDSEESYREKLETLKESYFPSKSAPTAKSESLSEGVDHAGDSVSGSMAGYLKTLKGLAG